MKTMMHPAPPAEAQTRAGEPEEGCFDRWSWLVLILAALIVGLGLAQALYRLALPADGWRYARDLSGTGRRLVLSRNLREDPSPLAPGDVLVAVEGQSVDDLLARALALRPRRPADWTDGHLARYTVERAGRVVTLDVPLRRRSTSEILRNLVESWAADPVAWPVLVIGLFVFLRRPRNGAARLLLLLTAAYFASNGLSQAVSDSNVLGPAERFDPVAFWPGQFFNALIWPLVIAPIYLHLFLRFPVVKAPLRRHPRPTLATLYLALPVVTLAALGVSRGQPLAFWQLWATLSSVDYFAVLLAAMVCVGHTLARERSPVGHAQVLWVAWGFLITTLGALIGGVIHLAEVPGLSLLFDLGIYRLAFLAFPLSLAIAILRWHLFDIDLVINRTLVYGAVTGVVVVTDVVCIYLLEFALRPFVADTTDLVVVGSTIVVVALFRPARRRLQDTIDRWFYRRKYDAARVLTAFGTTIRDEVDLTGISAHLLQVVDETVQPTHLSLWLKEPAEEPAS